MLKPSERDPGAAMVGMHLLPPFVQLAIYTHSSCRSIVFCYRLLSMHTDHAS